MAEEEDRQGVGAGEHAACGRSLSRAAPPPRPRSARIAAMSGIAAGAAGAATTEAAAVVEEPPSGPPVMTPAPWVAPWAPLSVRVRARQRSPP